MTTSEDATSRARMDISWHALPGIGTLTVYHDSREGACLLDLRVREVLDAGQIDTLTAALADARAELGSSCQH